MSDNGKKRVNSFRRLFPNFFTSHKSKEKNTSKETSSNLKSTSGGLPKSNQYESPRTVNAKPESQIQDINESERIYENLTISPKPANEFENVSNDVPSNHSSSSTLVSESVKTAYNPRVESKIVTLGDKEFKTYAARPQVPPRPQTERLQGMAADNQPRDQCTFAHYPDVYYHSLEKLTDKISPLDEIEIYKASKAQANPASVGAEIKRVSTKFLISPKKEADVRTIQPTRARSLSLENSKQKSEQRELIRTSRENEIRKNDVSKPYNYSAPTSPMPNNHRLPPMPKTISPYEQVRKAMIETEEKRNSLSRASVRNKTTPSPKLSDNNERSKASTPMPAKLDNSKSDDGSKEKTRQKVEAFYWQKLKEMKQKEDEFYLRQSAASPGSPALQHAASPVRQHATSPAQPQAARLGSTCSTPLSFVYENKSYSLPRGGDLSSYCSNQPIYTLPAFVRGAPERRTDTFIQQRTTQLDPDIVYRHPEKLNATISAPMKQTPMVQRGSLNTDARNVSLQPKRVSFEEYVSKNFDESASPNIYYEKPSQRIQIISNSPRDGRDVRGPPPPPIRTTSVGKTCKTPSNKRITDLCSGHSVYSESESGSEAGEIQRILQNNARKEDWHGDGSRIDGGLSDGEAGRSSGRSRSSRRDDPRRHTLADSHQLYHPLHQLQLGALDGMQRSGLAAPEYATVNKYRDTRHRVLDPRTRKPPLPRGYPQSNALLFDDDPGIMSEVETASTGFRRGGKQRSSLPVVRTPSKTLERPLGLVFLQYRNETKRALLPNEITSIDTVKALFVRSFPKQLTMQYMDSPLVKIYIHDSSKDMFYELEDVRAHLRDIRDRSVLRLFEATDMGGGVFPGAVGVGSMAMPAGAASCSGPASWDQDQSYFSEPEIDSEYHHQHVHKSKVKAPAYYMGTAAPSTLPRGGSLLRAFSPAAPPVPADRGNTLPAGGHGGDAYMSSPERGAARGPYEDPYYTQFLGPAGGRPSITPVIDEEGGDGVLIDDPAYQLYGVNAITTAPRPMPRPPYDARITPQVDDMQRLRVEKMERQLANLTGLVQKALQVPGAPPTAAPRQDFQTYATRPANQDAARFGTGERPPKLGRDKFQKSVSFEKSVSFSDDPPDMNSPKQHSPQHSADTKPTKPAIKSSTLPRTSSQERDRLKPAPPPKPAGLVGQQLSLVPQRTYTINVTPDFFSQMRMVQKQSRDLRLETRNLRRSTMSQAIQMRQMMAETIVKIGALAASFTDQDPDSQLTREEEIYRQDMLLLENDLYELEATVERLRGQAANRSETRVNMADIERIAMVLSKSSKTVADWKLKFPILQETMKVKLAAEMEKVVRKEKMLEEEPERLELALRRCKKLTGTLVTLKRLACVQEQRLPALNDGRISPGSSQSSTFTAGPSSDEFNSDSTCQMPQPHNKATGGVSGRGAARGEPRPENALDALLDELQTFSKPPERSARGDGPLRRLHSYPSGSDTDASPPVRARGQHPPKPPVPERHPELLALAARRAPPPPPPRTTSRSPLASPTSPASPPRAEDPNDPKDAARQALLEQRHQELLKKQKALQEQYARLQMIQRSGPMAATMQNDLKKTGSESNLLQKMNLNLAPASLSGSMTQLTDAAPPDDDLLKLQQPVATTNKVYETDIL